MHQNADGADGDSVDGADGADDSADVDAGDDDEADAVVDDASYADACWDVACQDLLSTQDRHLYVIYAFKKSKIFFTFYRNKARERGKLQPNNNASKKI